MQGSCTNSRWPAFGLLWSAKPPALSPSACRLPKCSKLLLSKGTFLLASSCSWKFRLFFPLLSCLLNEILIGDRTLLMFHFPCLKRSPFLPFRKFSLSFQFLIAMLILQHTEVLQAPSQVWGAGLRRTHSLGGGMAQMGTWRSPETGPGQESSSAVCPGTLPTKPSHTGWAESDPQACSLCLWDVSLSFSTSSSILSPGPTVMKLCLAQSSFLQAGTELVPAHDCPVSFMSGSAPHT